jgi:predicted NAD-dependent protein-ADP-ribosyltransferase YbiA (DUF1768 family)
MPSETDSSPQKNWLKEPHILIFGGASRGHLNYLDNFYVHDMQIDGLSYPSVEHYFQAAKFMDVDPDYAKTIRNAKTPKESKQSVMLVESHARPSRQQD